MDKLRLIWNLLLVGKSNVQHMLQAHYRAVTDINWHTTECDTVVSAGIDSWLWAWDLRDPRKPIFGMLVGGFAVFTLVLTQTYNI